MNICEIMNPGDVLIDILASSKAKLLKLLSEKAAAASGIDEHEILSALRSRESLGSTGIGAGIAIPHAPVPGITGPFGLFIRLAKPIEFEAIDDEPVDLVCLMLIPPGEQTQYLKLLSNIARQLRSPETVRKIRSATDSEQIYSAITHTKCGP